ncbi:YifB family Mg chelatase-like AAA ATPase [Schumannella sp. 10F1B-5-1]|uniref:YifB family Mg chelatase-like AAA ATPase n=1 Tax=Schumannella sp. 10F1B-5-1 TaxID=2590780 RepID=UPI0011309B63|nr:YifB family Mg chelatase-like AAA ATPase [Schumannella sp. 10F1B-5-1]TPW72351.1 YifB family Mg chelatase-like AAA ATPase [Schumannella sp. 10F1B-5-1]
MSVARTRAIALLGIEGAIVEVEADLQQGALPGFSLIGLPDTSLGEARERVRAAAANSGHPLSPRRMTINLSPASLPKHGSAFDLAIAVAALAAEGVVSPESVERVAHLGELGLDGRLRPIPGVLPAVLAAARAGVETVIVPSGDEPEASLVPGIRVVGMPSLRETLIFHGAELESEPVEPILRALGGDDDTATTRTEEALDLADVAGNREAVEALRIAAAGGHHLFLLGPPGAGKTMLVSRLPGILPDLSAEQALEVGSLRSLSGLPLGASLSHRPPLESPHHTATTASIVGGGSRAIRPGAAARASHGVLFLDEAPEFSPATLDALRQPLESGTLTVHRASATARFPAAFQLVLAANPCPCGQSGAPDAECVCTPTARRRYLQRMSGPLLDRVDIRLRVHRVTAAQLRLAAETPTMSTAQAREAVLAARERARQRLRGTPWRRNVELPGTWLRSSAGAPSPGSTDPLERALERGVLSMRGFDRVLRVAWTIADLDGVDRPGRDQIGRALHLRQAAA